MYTQWISSLIQFTPFSSSTNVSAAQLQQAIDNGNLEKTAEIVAMDAVANNVLPNGELPIVFAIRKKNLEMIKLLLDSGKVDLLKKDDQGLSPMDHAVMVGDNEIAATVFTYKIGRSFDATKKLVNTDAKLQGYCVEFEKAVNAWKTIDLTSSPFHQAAFMGDIEKLKELTASTKDLDAYQQYGLTPLHCAILGENLDAVEFLLQAGARIDVLTPRGHSALHFAALTGKRELLELCVESGLDLNKPESTGYTPLHFAMVQEQLFNAQYLIEKGANPLLADIHGVSSLAIGTALANQRALDRDPLKIDFHQTLMFSGLLLSWVAAQGFLEDADSLMGYGALMMYVASLGVMLKNTNSKLHTGVALVADVALSSIPGVNVAYNAFKSYKVGKAALDSLSSCWRNSGLNRYQALRNGIISSVNLAYSTKSLTDNVSSAVPFIMQPGVIDRASQFIPACIKTNTAGGECFNRFGTLESIRRNQGIAWEVGADGLVERWKAFLPLCRKEIPTAEKCNELFWSFENKRYLTGWNWEQTLPPNFVGRDEREVAFDTQCNQIHPGSPQICQTLFTYFEGLKYKMGIDWETRVSGVVDRWNEYTKECTLIDQSECLGRFWGHEGARYFDKKFWEVPFKGMYDRWQEFSPDCLGQYSEKTADICKDLFFKFEESNYYYGKQWAKAWKESLKYDGSPWKQFLPECLSVRGTLDECKSQFVDIETKRIYEQPKIEATFEGMFDRWKALQPAASVLKLGGETKQLFWELEENRVFSGMHWEDNLAGIKVRKKAFKPVCKENLKDIDFQNTYSGLSNSTEMAISNNQHSKVPKSPLELQKDFLRCDTLFKQIEVGHLKKGYNWVPNWNKHSDGIKGRWEIFNSGCSTIQPSLSTCETLFLEKLEPNLYAHGKDYSNEDSIRNLAKFWNDYKIVMNPNTISMSVEDEKEFWSQLIAGLAENQNKASCPPIDTDKLGKMGYADMIQELDPKCNAELILGLNATWTPADCKKQYKLLSKEFHPDKYQGDPEGIVFQKINDAYESLCQKKD